MSRFADCQPIVLAYIERDEKVLITLRPSGVAQGGCWEFPGGKVEPGEMFSEALSRELLEEIGVAAIIGEEIAVSQYAYPDVCVELHLFRCTIIAGEPAPRASAAIRWVFPDQLERIPFPPANAPLLAAFRDKSKRP